MKKKLFRWEDRFKCPHRCKDTDSLGRPKGHVLCDYGAIGRRCMKRICPKLRYKETLED